MENYPDRSQISQDSFERTTIIRSAVRIGHPKPERQIEQIRPFKKELAQSLRIASAAIGRSDEEFLDVEKPIARYSESPANAIVIG